jgi:MFS family permease
MKSSNIRNPAYLVELWPYSHRSRGIGVQQIFGKLAGFFSTNVNSIALSAIAWRYLAIYCGWIFFEFCIVFLLYPETSGRTLEELAFCKPHPPFLAWAFELTWLLQCSRTVLSMKRRLLPSRSRFTMETIVMQLSQSFSNYHRCRLRRLFRADLLSLEGDVD